MLEVFDNSQIRGMVSKLFVPSFQIGGLFKAGAWDGVEHSNTLFFEKYRRWSGLLIKPQRAYDYITS